MRAIVRTGSYLATSFLLACIYFWAMGHVSVGLGGFWFLLHEWVGPIGMFFAIPAATTLAVACAFRAWTGADSWGPLMTAAGPLIIPFAGLIAVISIECSLERCVML
jgi:hypothetical protein